ncbi:hypothetical protein MTP99_001963 [Tenebrio molitor]|nr:hypothetical protein MTP99_001963 [Tenebrio molitor]
MPRTPARPSPAAPRPSPPPPPASVSHAHGARTLIRCKVSPGCALGRGRRDGESPARPPIRAPPDPPPADRRCPILQFTALGYTACNYRRSNSPRPHVPPVALSNSKFPDAAGPGGCVPALRNCGPA